MDDLYKLCSYKLDQMFSFKFASEMLIVHVFFFLSSIYFLCSISFSSALRCIIASITFASIVLVYMYTLGGSSHISWLMLSMFSVALYSTNAILLVDVISLLA